MDVLSGAYDFLCCGIPSYIWSFFTTCKCKFFENGYSGYDWAWGTIYLVAKEYIAVILQLVFFSRIGTTPDLLTAALILYVMLVSFAFPFMSSYLFLTLRMGPFHSDKVPYPLGTLRNLMQIGLVIAAHCLGALTAAEFMKANKHNWDEYETL